jgi:hypothetical protein
VASDPAQKRLRWIIGGLLGLAAIILIATIWFWRATRPSRGVTVTAVNDGTTVDPSWERPAIPTSVGAVSGPDALPLMAVSAPLPPLGGTPAASVAAFVPASSVSSPPPVAPADVYGTAPAPPGPPPAGTPDQHWYQDDEPDPPAFEEPEPPRFEEPDPPRFEEPEATAMLPAVEPAGAVGGHDSDNDRFDDRLAERLDDDGPWEPRSEPDVPSDSEEQWRGIRPLGPIPRGE